MRLSLLDRSRTRAGEPDAAGVTHTVERARWIDDLGYHRFWVAEHHAVPGIASGAPPVLLAAIGAQTSRVRIGSGGVMLPNHQPLVVAEQFLLLESLHPGRVDVGIGRSLGFTAPVRAALRTAPEEDYDADVRELTSYLDGTAPVTARPQVAGRLPVHLLATGRGVDVAAALGLPLVVGGPMLGGDGDVEPLDRYRRAFVPSERLERPHVIASLDVTVADDDATARDLALPEAWAMAMSRRDGEFPPLEPVAAIRDRDWPEQVRRRVEASLDAAVTGSPATVRERLERLVERTGADEVMASTSTHDRAALRASDELLRDVVVG